MWDYLNAILKGLSSISPPPFRALGEFASQLQTNKSIKKIEILLRSVVSEQKGHQQVTKELKGLRNVPNPVILQYANGTLAVVELHKKGQLQVSNADGLQDAINEQLAEDHVQVFRKNMFITLETLTQECIDEYGDNIDRFLDYVKKGGFLTGELPQKSDNDIVISKCIERLMSKRYTDGKRISILGYLAKKTPGSNILQLTFRFMKAMSSTHKKVLKKKQANDSAGRKSRSRDREGTKTKKLSYIIKIADVLGSRQRIEELCSRQHSKTCELSDESLALCKEVGLSDAYVARSLKIVLALGELRKKASKINKMTSTTNALVVLVCSIDEVLLLAEPGKTKFGKLLVVVNFLQDLKKKYQNTEWYKTGSYVEGRDWKIRNELTRSTIKINKIQSDLFKTLRKNMASSGQTIEQKMARFAGG